MRLKRRSAVSGPLLPTCFFWRLPTNLLAEIRTANKVWSLNLDTASSWITLVARQTLSLGLACLSLAIKHSSELPVLMTLSTMSTKLLLSSGSLSVLGLIG